MNSTQALVERGRRRLDAQTPRAHSPITEWTLGDIARNAGRVMGIGGLLLGLSLVCGTVLLLFTRPEYAWPFVAIGAATWGGVQFWRNAGGRGMPLLPLLLVQQWVIYSLPLVARNPTVDNYPEQTLTWCAVAVVIALVVACIGWRLGCRLTAARPSHYNLSLGRKGMAGQHCLKLALLLMACALAFELLAITGIIWKVLPGQLGSIYPALHTFASAAASLGALLGAFALPSAGNRSLRFIFWGLFYGEFLLLVRDILLSAATGLVLSIAIGLALGSRRIPWRILLLMGALLGFLNFGKPLMRERYWIEGNTTGVSLTKLPSFYLEWADETLRLVGATPVGGNQSKVVQGDEQGQSMLARVDNLQNLLFVVHALEGCGVAPLNGRTYTLIPALLIPRFLWPDKPRTHEGQIILNLQFGRQNSLEDTERTYIAWGLLPEAVGNFGPLAGAVFFGAVAGLACGLVETWSARKRLFSVEGLLALALLVQVASSFEMVASVFITAMFQLICAVAVGGFAIYAWLGGGGTVRRLECDKGVHAGKRASC